MSPDRRPLAIREAGWSKWLAGFAGRMGATPNGISLTGMVFGVLAGGMLAATSWTPVGWWGFWGAAICVQLRLLANMLDGMVAIERGRTSAVGELFNEVPDRVSDTATLVGAGYALGGNPELGYWTAILALFLAYLRAQGKVAGSPQHYCGPMAKQHRMAVITVASLAAVLWPVVPLSVVKGWNDAGLISCALVLILLGEVITVYRRLEKIARSLRERQMVAGASEPAGGGLGGTVAQSSSTPVHTRDSCQELRND